MEHYKSLHNYHELSMYYITQNRYREESMKEDQVHTTTHCLQSASDVSCDLIPLMKFLIHKVCKIIMNFLCITSQRQTIDNREENIKENQINTTQCLPFTNDVSCNLIPLMKFLVHKILASTQFEQFCPMMKFILHKFKPNTVETLPSHPYPTLNCPHPYNKVPLQVHISKLFPSVFQPYWICVSHPLSIQM